MLDKVLNTAPLAVAKTKPFIPPAREGTPEAEVAAAVARSAFEQKALAGNTLAGLPTPAEPVFAETMATVVKLSKEALATPAEIEKLAELQGGWRNCWRGVCKDFIPSAAKLEWQKHQQEMSVRARAGTLNEPQDSWDLEAFRKDFLSRQVASKRAGAEVVLEALPIARAIVGRYVKLARTIAATVEVDARKQHESFGVPFQGSPIAAAILLTTERAKIRVSNDSPGWANSPAALIEGIVIL